MPQKGTPDAAYGNLLVPAGPGPGFKIPPEEILRPAGPERLAENPPATPVEGGWRCLQRGLWIPRENDPPSIRKKLGCSRIFIDSKAAGLRGVLGFSLCKEHGIGEFPKHVTTTYGISLSRRPPLGEASFGHGKRERPCREQICDSIDQIPGAELAMAAVNHRGSCPLPFSDLWGDRQAIRDSGV